MTLFSKSESTESREPSESVNLYPKLNSDEQTVARSTNAEGGSISGATSRSRYESGGPRV